MTRPEVLATLRVILVRATDVPELGGDRTGSPYFEDPDSIDESTSLGELGLDSLALTAIAVDVERELDIELSPVLMFEVRTIGDLVDTIVTEVASRRPS